MKNTSKKIFCITILCFFVASALWAQCGTYRRKHSMRDENSHGRVSSEYYNDFYVEKIYYTVDQNVLTINIHFTKSIDPKSLNEENIQLYGERKPLEMEFAYNRSGTQVQIDAVFDSTRNLIPLDITLTDARCLQDASLENFSFTELMPTTIYEYTQGERCHTY